ncbi:hypothetical protein JZ751_016362 [Albula glossodonta]|uniref:V-type proton ATPase subunit a n=1 Tax=Albula glossodonta TaxID=121402 RepID=A0A8T2NY53_9TELE|nr:hypothetical protein JZ751_016362 [Albula glossodonta]
MTGSSVDWCLHATVSHNFISLFSHLSHLFFVVPSLFPADSLHSFVAGVVHPWKVLAFERLLWRACRGYIIINFREMEEKLEEPDTGEMVQWTVFLISYWGEQIGQKVKKICDWRCPKQWDIAKILEELEEQFGTAVCPPPRPPLPQVLSQTECFLGQLLAQVEEVLPCWKVRVWKCKAVHAVLNLCSPSVTDKCLIAEAWCPLSQLPALQGALTEGGRKSGSGVDSFYNCLSPPTSPPTLFSTNSFTAGFQSIVDTYGVANYREVNPAMFTIITFPFLFAVMFGDVGHGMLLTLLALWMLLQERDPKLSTSGNEVGPPTRDTPTAMAHCKGKCIICFSRGLSLFPSSWHLQPMMRHYNWSDETLHGNQYLTLDPSVEGVFQGPYPFGIDPVWRLATNHLTFLNSYKMKMSVIIGVVHMTFGVCLSFFNYILFGYLVFMVVLKWLTCGPLDSDRAPSVLMHFINMFLLTQSKENPPLYPGQEVVQRVLVLLALCSVPHSLLSDTSSINALQGDLESGQPAEEETGDQRPLLSDTSSINALQGDLESGRQAGEETEFDVVEVFMYQAIHTIEYCLGCISNTASYLRLWALSLAHSQLSEVLWVMVLRVSLAWSGWVGSVVLVGIFSVFALLTVSILLLMEGLVEFQNKFYSGSGYKLSPFSFTSSMNTL